MTICEVSCSSFSFWLTVEVTFCNAAFVRLTYDKSAFVPARSLRRSSMPPRSDTTESSAFVASTSSMWFTHALMSEKARSSTLCCIFCSSSSTLASRSRMPCASAFCSIATCNLLMVASAKLNRSAWCVSCTISATSGRMIVHRTFWLRVKWQSKSSPAASARPGVPSEVGEPVCRGTAWPSNPGSMAGVRVESEQGNLWA
mmetsp:Transcript_38131/g.105008  ORF Transcript_38131/g.105008 Transcript_38131/m.105008 type:complete len:201 (-) Transcript_38131:17-619(-)